MNARTGHVLPLSLEHALVRALAQTFPNGCIPPALMLRDGVPEHPLPFHPMRRGSRTPTGPRTSPDVPETFSCAFWFDGATWTTWVGPCWGSDPTAHQTLARAAGDTQTLDSITQILGLLRPVLDAIPTRTCLLGLSGPRKVATLMWQNPHGLVATHRTALLADSQKDQTDGPPPTMRPPL